MLTILQEKGIKLLTEFIGNSDPTYTIAGYAGTGKTYLLQHFINNNFKNKVCVTAFTHKAVQNISDGVGVPGHTIHSLLGLAPNMNLDSFNPNSPTFSLQFEEKMAGYRLIIVDECSQVGHELYSYLISRAIRYNVKLIFVGDPCQLPPINEFLSDTFKTKNIFWLTEIIRQNIENPILNILSELRKDIFNNSSNAINMLRANTHKENEIGEGYTVLPKLQFEDKLFNYLQPNMIYEPDDFRFTAFTRNTVDTTNISIHKNKYNNIEGAKQLNIGDLLTAHSTIVDKFLTPIIINSLDYTITDVLEMETVDNIIVFAVKLSNPTTPLLKNHTFFIVKHELANLLNLVKLLKPLYDNACQQYGANRRIAWKNYYAIKEQYLLLFDFEFEGLKLQKDISYGYGLTTYKVQGSTYGTVFTNLIDICCWKADPTRWIVNNKTNPNAIIIRNKHIYVALSRAKHHNYIML
jgi:hypothetical protein